MGEALISRAGGTASEADQIIPVVPGICTLLVTVKDSLNRPAVGIQVNCKDGTSWYNYTTNDKGQCMFSTNSGSANITAYNRYQNGIWILDQQASAINIDAPVSTSNKINLQFNGYDIGYELNFTQPGGSSPKPPTFPAGNYAFMVSKKIAVFVGGGGGGGGGTYTSTTGGVPGCAGGANDGNITINAGSTYYGSIGAGGTGGYTTEDYNPPASYGGTGGTSTFANISAGGGSWNNYGYGKYATGKAGQTSALSNFGGGGGYASTQNGSYTNWRYPGGPGGGSGGLTIEDDGSSVGATAGGAGTNGLGGGGGAAGWYWRGRYRGGVGGSGTIRIKFLE